jgi:hypothetical protein
MKKSSQLIAALALLGASFNVAANGPAGCGVGTAVVFPDANEWHEHVLAATTNATSLNTVSMTANLLNCDTANGPLKMAEAFMNDNMDQLAADSARGQGETLDALAQVMGIEAADTAAFRATVQSNFDSMFTTEATASEAFRSLTEAMAQDEALQKYVG